MPFLEFLRQYNLREYAAVLAFALLGAAGLVFMLNSASGGSASGELTLVKRETAHSAPGDSVRYVEAEQSVAARRAARLAKQRTRAQRRARAAARQAAAVAAAQARSRSREKQTIVRADPQPTVPQATAPTRVVNTPAPRPAPKPAPAPAPKPTPKKSGTSGGGGGSFDDSG